MTKKIEDLIASFTNVTFDEQLERIRRARSARTIERPVAAVKRVKKERKKSDQNMTKAKGLLSKLSTEERLKLIAKLKGELT